MPGEGIWELGEELGLTREQVDFEIASMRDYEFRTPRSEWTRVMRNWLRETARRGRSVGGVVGAYQQRPTVGARTVAALRLVASRRQ